MIATTIKTASLKHEISAISISLLLFVGLDELLIFSSLVNCPQAESTLVRQIQAPTPSMATIMPTAHMMDEIMMKPVP